MKKSYVKPQVYFEDFQLSASIAAGCTFKTGPVEYQCAYEPTPGRFVFLEGVSACVTTTEDGTDYTLCYHNPAETSRLFAS